jgi:hypothetical protein
LQIKVSRWASVRFVFPKINQSLKVVFMFAIRIISLPLPVLNGYYKAFPRNLSASLRRASGSDAAQPQANVS